MEVYSRGKLNGDTLMLELMEQYGWSYEAFQETPSFLIEIAKEKKVRDNKEKEMEARKINKRYGQ